jgi:hypothetical protein
MVINPVTHGWSWRLENLRRLIDREPDGPVWYWRIRVRILRYLLARYPESTEHPVAITPDRELPPGAAAEAPPPALPVTVVPMVAVQHPPKPPALLAELLDDVHHVNREHRIAEQVECPPDLVWEWWRRTWCLPRGS